MRSPLFIVLLVLLFSCGSKDKIPARILSREKMQAVLWDIMRADIFLSDFVFPKDSSVKKDQASISLYSQVFSRHGISRDQFRESFAYYKSHPVQLKIIMDSLNVMPELAPSELYKPLPVDSSYPDRYRQPKVNRDTSGRFQKIQLPRAD